MAAKSKVIREFYLRCNDNIMTNITLTKCYGKQFKIKVEHGGLTFSNNLDIDLLKYFVQDNCEIICTYGEVAIKASKLIVKLHKHEQKECPDAQLKAQVCELFRQITQLKFKIEEIPYVKAQLPVSELYKYTIVPHVISQVNGDEVYEFGYFWQKINCVYYFGNDNNRIITGGPPIDQICFAEKDDDGVRGPVYVTKVDEEYIFKTIKTRFARLHYKGTQNIMNKFVNFAYRREC